MPCTLKPNCTHLFVIVFRIQFMLFIVFFFCNVFCFMISPVYFFNRVNEYGPIVRLSLLHKDLVYVCDPMVLRVSNKNFQAYSVHFLYYDFRLRNWHRDNSMKRKFCILEKNENNDLFLRRLLFSISDVFSYIFYSKNK